MHTVTPGECGYLLVLTSINVGGGCIPNFYIIYKGKEMKKNYIKRCERVEMKS